MVYNFPRTFEAGVRTEAHREVSGQIAESVPIALEINVFGDAAANPRILMQRSGPIPQVLQRSRLECRLRQNIKAIVWVTDEVMRKGIGEESAGAISRIMHQTGQCLCAFALHGALKLKDPSFRRIASSQDGGDARGRECLDGVEVGKYGAVAGESVEIRRCRKLVAVHRHIFGAKSVEADQQDVGLRAL